MNQFAANEQLLIKQFEGREAIYIEKGALRVRIFNIRLDLSHKEVTADVEELPTPGLGFVMGHTREFDERSPRRWQIGTTESAGSTFTSRHWSGGAYVVWSLFFDPEIVSGVMKLAGSFPPDLHLPPVTDMS